MKKSVAVAAGLLLFALTAFAAEGVVRGEGHYESNTLENLPAFHAVEVLGDADVEIVQRSTPKVIVSGLSGLTSLADVRVENGILVVSYKKPVHVKGKHHLHVIIGAPQLTAITAAQNSDVKVRGALNADELTLTARDKGEIQANLVQADKLVLHAADRSEMDVEHIKVNRVEVKTFHRAEVELSGQAQEAWLENNGSGEINAEDLFAKKADAMTFSSGDIHTRVLTQLHAVANGSGKIKYKGRPSKLVREGHVKNIKQAD